jgi:3-hydroxyacyl-[acyl-carrier-protein] dehydratase
VRYVLVDRSLDFEEGARVRAVKCVTLGEEFLADLDAYPAALVLEALLQAGGALARAARPERSILGKVDRASFPDVAHVGERIDLEVRVTMSRPEATLCKGVATVGDRVVGEAEFMIVFLPPELTPPPDPVVDEYRRNLKRALGIPEEFI